MLSSAGRQDAPTGQDWVVNRLDSPSTASRGFHRYEVSHQLYREFQTSTDWRCACRHRRPSPRQSGQMRARRKIVLDNRLPNQIRACGARGQADCNGASKCIATHRLQHNLCPLGSISGILRIDAARRQHSRYSIFRRLVQRPLVIFFHK